jgi:bifunctional non-homologous end joining protein LigD
MQAKLVPELPEGEDWIYEVKWDGYRVETIKHGDTVRLISRNAKNLTPDYPEVRDAVARIRAHTAVLDGEVVALDDQGKPSFQRLQHRGSLGRNRRIVYYAFDLLNLNGQDLRAVPLIDRKEKLATILRDSGILFSANLETSAADVAEQIKKLDLEGVVAKRRNSRYESANRSGAWLKVQFKRSQEFIIGGYKPEADGTVRSIVVGYYDNGKLMSAGKVRGGFNPLTRAQLLKAMKPLEVGTDRRAVRCPFTDLPRSKKSHWGEGITAEEMAEIKWLKPKLVAQIKFTEWTRDGNLRHASYLGLRHDKSSKEVIREI